MTKNDFVKAVADAAEFTQKDTRVLLNALAEVTYKTLSAGDEVSPIDGLKLYVKDIPERTGHNPQTGEAIVIPAHKAVKAKFGVAFKTLDLG